MALLQSLTLPPPGWLRRASLPLALFVLTACTTTITGSSLAAEFANNLPAFSGDLLEPYRAVWRNPARIWSGLPFSVTLLGILLAHELGHYIACLHYRVRASPPHFLPAPTLIGTFGAFIRIRSPIYSRIHLFDIGIAGPLAGFLFAGPALAIGLAYSKVIPGIATQGDFVFGSPLCERLLALLIFPGVDSGDLYLHPVARAAWVGLLATALNLLPIGQLDGGHILYAFLGDRHKLLSRIFVFLLVPLALVTRYWGWLLWAVLLFFFGLRHPSIHDRQPLGSGRVLLGLLSLAIFAATFSLAPIGLNLEFE